MKVPAVAIAAALAGGIVLGQWRPVARYIPSPPYLTICFAGAALLIGTGVFLAKKNRLLPAAAISFLSWSLLGTLAAGIAEQPRPSDHVLMLLQSGRLDLKSPLQWHGWLRDEPARVPLGYGYEIELTGVDFEGKLLPVHGGLRVSFTPPEAQPSAPDVHAGDEIAVVTQANRPQVFKDEGAFDRRAYLEQQNIDLTAMLRAAELMERISSPRLTAGIRLARARRKLRETIDALFAGKPHVAGVLRAMLLGDRSFVDRSESTDFQKTGVFHILVVAGLHVGALAVFLFWVAQKLRLASFWRAIITLAFLFA